MDKEALIFDFSDIGVQSPTAVTFTFSEVIGQGVILSSPANTAPDIAVNPTLSWQALAGWGYYNLQVSAQADFSTFVENVIITGTSRQVFLDNAITYHWRVRGANTSIPQEVITVTSISILPASPQIVPGGTRQLAATVDGTGDFDTSVTWSKVSGVAGITIDANGLVTATEAVAPTETAVFRARSQGNNTITAETTVTAIADPGLLSSQAGDEAFLQDLYAATTFVSGDNANWDDSTGWSASINLSTTTPYGVEKTLIGDQWRVTRLNLLNNGLGRVVTGTSAQFTSVTSISGNIITDNNYPAEQVLIYKQVLLRNASSVRIASTIADASGNYSFTGLTSGNYTTSVEWREGYIPRSFGNLSACKYINFKHNSLWGEIPDTISGLTAVEWLMFSGLAADNELWRPGALHPGKQTNENTFLQGSIPDVFDSLPNLIVFEAAANNFTGSWPPSLARCPKLQLILIHRFQGSTEPGVAEIYGRNKPRFGMSGPIPNNWELCQSLKVIQCGSHRLTGAVPSTIGPLPVIYELKINGNLFESIPDTFEGSNIGMINGDRNAWTGPFPRFFWNGNNPGLIRIRWSSSPPNFTGSLAGININNTPRMSDFTGDSSQRLTDWTDFFASSANLGSNPQVSGAGPILFNFGYSNINIAYPPNMFQYWTRARQLGQVSAGMIGKIPPVNINNRNFRFAQFNSNNHEGPIPESYAQVHRLDESGNISPTGAVTAGGLGWYIEFSIHNNSFSGPLPVKLGDYNFTAGFRLYNNRFTYSDIIPLLNNLSYGTPTYHPQKPFPVAYADHVRLDTGAGLIAPQPLNDVSVTFAAGSTITLNLSAIDITGNVYQWRKNGVDLTNGGDISDATTHTLVIANADLNDEGEYTLRITNPNAPQLTESISETITVQLL